MPTRVIAHLDMDAFYASVELLRYPELRGLPVVIGGGSRHQPVWEDDPATGERKRRFATLRNYAGRGVVTTATYEAREFGVNSAMGMMKAAQLAPDAVLLPTDFDEYRKYSRLFKAAVRSIAPTVEDRGIDEIYIDLTDLVAARLAGARAGVEVIGPRPSPGRRTRRSPHGPSHRAKPTPGGARARSRANSKPRSRTPPACAVRSAWRPTS
jgi:DNA polymerase-4